MAVLLLALGMAMPLAYAQALVQPLSVTPSSSSSVTAGQSMTLSVSGGTAPYLWGLADGANCPGTGAASSDGSTFNYIPSGTSTTCQFTVSDSGNPQQSGKSGIITVNPAPTSSTTTAPPTTILPVTVNTTVPPAAVNASPTTPSASAAPQTPPSNGSGILIGALWLLIAAILSLQYYAYNTHKAVMAHRERHSEHIKRIKNAINKSDGDEQPQ